MAGLIDLFRGVFSRWPFTTTLTTLSVPTVAGVSVTERTALNYSVVYGIVRIMSSTIAMLPWHVYSQDGRTRNLESDNPIDRLLHTQPNPEMSAFTFREVLQAHALLWGNGLAEIERDKRERITALWPLPPDRMKIRRNEAGVLEYVMRTGANTDVVFSPDSIFHLKGLGFDGIQGQSPISLARESISFGLALEKYGAAFFGNDARPSVVVEHPGRISKEASDRLRESIEERHSGAAKSWRPMMLQEDMKIKTMSVPPEDAQYLGTRLFQVEEMCRWYGIQPYKVADLERAIQRNLEQMGREFYTDTMMPWAVRWEQEAQIKLLGVDTDLFTKFNFNAIMRGDMQTRGEFYKALWPMGALSINDILELEDRNPVGADGDERFVPLNMVALSHAVRDGGTGSSNNATDDQPKGTNGILEKIEALGRM